jgi:hypothetical protein
VHDQAPLPSRPLEGSRRTTAEHDAPIAVFSQLHGRRLVVVEKLDGDDASIAFRDGRLEVHGDDGAHAWADRHRDALLAVLGERWVVYGQWLQRKRLIFYDALPAWFVATFVHDRDRDAFALASHRFANTPIATVPVLHDGLVRSLKALHALVGPSRYKTPRWRETLREASRAAGLDPDVVAFATDPLDLAAGLVTLVEHDGDVLEGIEFVRPSFGSAVLDAGPDAAIDNALTPGAGG